MSNDFQETEKIDAVVDFNVDIPVKAKPEKSIQEKFKENPFKSFDTTVNNTQQELFPSIPDTTTIVEEVEEDESSKNELELESIERQLKIDEDEILQKISEVDELSNLVNTALKNKLKASIEDKRSGNIIFVDGFSDILQSQSRLLGLGIDGRTKLAVLRKNRYNLIKSKTSKDNGLSLMDLLS